jgi:hypothetical protein
MPVVNVLLPRISVSKMFELGTQWEVKARSSLLPGKLANHSQNLDHLDLADENSRHPKLEADFISPTKSTGKWTSPKKELSIPDGSLIDHTDSFFAGKWKHSNYDDDYDDQYNGPR